MVIDAGAAEAGEFPDAPTSKVPIATARTRRDPLGGMTLSIAPRFRETSGSVLDACAVRENEDFAPTGLSLCASYRSGRSRRISVR
jgi:hypothetical protein